MLAKHSNTYINTPIILDLKKHTFNPIVYLRFPIDRDVYISAFRGLKDELLIRFQWNLEEVVDNTLFYDMKESGLTT